MTRCLVLLTALASAALAGCGGGDDGLADQPGTSIVADSAKALGAVRSYHVEGTQTDADGRTTIRADVDAKGPLRIDVLQRAQEVSLLLLSGAETYLRADAGFWRASGGAGGAAVAGRLADRWVKVPASGASAFEDLADELRPATLARCFVKGLGTLEVEGTRTEAGKEVVVVRDAGDRPGSSPGELAVATKGPALPLRATQTGGRRPGGRLDERCQDADDTSTASDLRFSRYDAVPALKAPPDAIDLSQVDAPGATA